MSQQQKEWYKKPWGIVVAILLLPFFIIWYAWAKSKWSKGIKIGVTVASLIIIGIAVSTSPKQETATKSQDKPLATEQSTTPAKTNDAPKPTVTAPVYEILSSDKSNDLLRVTVYTTETADDKLIAMNDKLVADNKKGVTHLFIDYFNDKAAAKNYFDKQADDSLSEAQKDELYTHYIAKMVYNTSTNTKTLTKQGATQTVLKVY